MYYKDHMASEYTTFLSIILLACTFHQHHVCAEEPGMARNGNNSDSFVSRRIDNFVKHIMQCHQTPTLTLAVVKDGQVLMTKAYGYTNTNNTRRATSKTKFAIASLTKAFTATLVAKWIHEQENITLDTPIKSFYPEFRVTDDRRSSEATFRDLLSHRMAIPAYFKPLMMGFPLDVSRDELVKRMADMPSDLSFRDKFVYNNYMYLLAAHVVEKMSGNKTWEELIRNSFLTPLKMSNTGFLNDVNGLSDLALPCALFDDHLVDLPKELFTAVTPCGPAGSIYSNAEDMAKWIQFLLYEGVGPDDTKVVSPEVIQMTFEPGIIPDLPFEELRKPEFPLSHVQMSYNLGWVTANYRGYRQIFHTGGFVTHSSRLWLYPDIKAGIYVNVNGPQRGGTRDLLGSLMYFASDMILGEVPWNQSVECTNELMMDTTQAPDAETTSSAPENSDLIEGLNQTTVYDDEEDFVGNYTHKCFGTIEITLKSDATTPSLVFVLGRYGWLDLYRYTSLAFLGKYFGPLSYLNSIERLNFTRNSEGVVDSVLYSLDDKSDPVRFERGMKEKAQNNDKHYENTGSSYKTSVLWTSIFISSVYIFSYL